ncbi:MAG: hypothetical protein ONB16_08785, partial [candidate division KSB1 bacterium]|nr:hypothetical protein [candidate division KSB1 bacterium]
NNRQKSLYAFIPELNPLSKKSATKTGITRISAIGDYGDTLAITQTAANTWSINTKKSNIVIISYKIKIQKDRALGECLSRRFARVDGASVFMCVREYDQMPIVLSVRVPHRWKLATGLSLTDQQFVYRADNYRQLLNRPLYIAPFADIFFTIQNRTCYIILDGDKKFNYDSLSVLTHKVMTNQLQLFKDVPFDTYLFIFRMYPDNVRLVSKAYENCSIVYAPVQTARDDLLKIVRLVASNFFQTWNGFRFYPIFGNTEAYNRDLIERHWFVSGVSDYYGHLNLVRANLISADEFIQEYVRLMNHLNQYAEYSNTPLSQLPLIFGNDPRVHQFIRLKGHLVGVLLDLQIRELSKNQRSLDDVILFMNNWFGLNNGEYQDSDLPRAIKAVSGVDVSEFFDKYIDGVLPPPIETIFQSAGIFFRSQSDTIADLGYIVISDETNEVLDLSEKGPLAFAGLRVGDRLLSLANHKLNSSRDLEQIIDTLGVSSYIDFSVQRDKLFLMLSARVKGRASQRYYLSSSTPKSDFQQFIRRTWLTNRSF